MFSQIRIVNGPIHKGKVFDFKDGVTAITGANGCGKSLLVEYMAFSLFGSVALRGKVSDYKNLEVITTLGIKRTFYSIHRTTKDCTITNGVGEIICSGTKACNLKIITLLGYDYNVYKMGNYAEQLDILGLGKMKPSERKTALDRTLGIGIVDKLIKYTNDKALQYKHEMDGLSLAIQEPGEEPVKPQMYQESSIIAGLYETQTKWINDYTSFKNMKKPEEPVKPVKPEGLEDWNLLALTNAVTQRSMFETKLEACLKQERPVFDFNQLVKMQEDWNKYEQYLSYAEKVKLLYLDQEPTLTWEQLNHQIEVRKNWDEYEEKLKAYDLGKVKCPDCGKEFNPYKEAPVQPKEAVTASMEMLEKEKERLQKKDILDQIEVVPVWSKPEIDKDEIIRQLNLHRICSDLDEKIENLKRELSGLEGATPENLHRLQKYDTELELYDHLRAIYIEQSVQYDQMADIYADYDEETENNRLNNLAVQYNEAVQYERDLYDYQKRKDAYDSLMIKMNELSTKVGQYKQAVDNLKEMKLKIKGYVLPSLQKVTSILLSEMSDGLFTNVVIDPEFNILVEGREVNLFSGSEQAMINLALRLGLGQVLTHKAFSVFIGDEIDASMRDDRAQLTADCLRKVSKYIRQVILVSHRDIEADHYINLEEGDK